MPYRRTGPMTAREQRACLAGIGAAAALWSAARGALYAVAGALDLARPGFESPFERLEVYHLMAHAPELAWAAALVVPAALALWSLRLGRWRRGSRLRDGAFTALAVVHLLTVVTVLPVAPLSPAWAASALACVACLAAAKP